MKKIINGIFIGIFITLLLGGGVYYLKNNSVPKCNFEIIDLKEYKGEYSSGSNYIIYEGLIKNNSEREEYLNAMLAKVYTDKDILITEGYTNIGKRLEDGRSIPFKISTFIDTAHNTIMRKYFDKNVTIKPDIYPWFQTCK
ncbi:MAG: hypothetical protein WCT22_03235 [Patescibacteria group bacterium]|jgi:hypothetical protein